MSPHSGRRCNGAGRAAHRPVEHERSILKRKPQAEPGISDSHLNFRFGMAGFGLSGQPEFGLGAVTAERVAEWARERFGRGNVMAFMTGAPPADLRLQLNEGAAFPTPRPIPEPTAPAVARQDTERRCRDRLPARAHDRRGTFLALYHRMLRQRLRLERGLIYDVLADYQPLDATWAAALVGGERSPARPGGRGHRVGRAQPSDERGGRPGRGRRGDRRLPAVHRAGLRRSPASSTRWSVTSSPACRSGPPKIAIASSRRRQPSTSPATPLMRRSLILLADVEQHTSDIVAYPMSSTDLVAGREVKPLLSVLGLGPKVRLTIGPDGVSLRAKDGSLATVRYADCVVLERPKDDELVMWGRDLSRGLRAGGLLAGRRGVLAEIAAASPARDRRPRHVQPRLHRGPRAFSGRRRVGAGSARGRTAGAGNRCAT